MAAQNTNLSPRIHQNQNLRQVNYSHRVAITQYVSLQKRQLPKIFWFYSSHWQNFKVQNLIISMRVRARWTSYNFRQKLSTFSGNFWTGLIIISDNRLMAALLCCGIQSQRGRGRHRGKNWNVIKQLRQSLPLHSGAKIKDTLVQTGNNVSFDSGCKISFCLFGIVFTFDWQMISR